MNGQSHKERLRAALAGEPVDRPPVALWWHDFRREWSPEELAAFTVEQYRMYDWDLVKLNPRATYYAEAWGSRFEPTGTSQPRRISHPLHRIEELADLPMIDPTAGVFGEQLDGLRRVVGQIGGEVDVIQTVFNPLTVASALVGMRPDAFREAAAGNAAAVHAGLARIARVLADYSAACIEAGASGIFFATVEWATQDSADENFYREYGRPYDLQVLAAVRTAPLNVLHVCRDRNMLDLVLDYPVRMFNWDAHGEGNPTLAEVAGRTGAGVMGGIERGIVAAGTPETVAARVREDLPAAPATRFVAAGGCAIAADAPPENVRAVVDAVRA
jgi:uroporphyrinogen decarboxylase